MADKKWTKPTNLPGPLFFGKKERDLVKQVNDELLERIISQQILYFPISLEHTNYHALYGEAIKKTFLPPIRVYAMIEWQGHETDQEDGLTDKHSSITVNFHRRRLTEDQDLYVRSGDFVRYGTEYYEIIETNEPRELFGQVEHRFEITAICKKVREGIFDAE